MNGLTIIVAGYPKSGNTWITRLVAEVVGCPVAGFWGAPKHKELAIEGTERDSPHKVYKSHHKANHFNSLPADHRLIYLVRDPRDVACSGAHYFGVNKFREKNPTLKHYDKYEAMVDMMVRGGYGHLDKPWLQHVSAFLELGCLVVRYEDMLDQPIQELRRCIGSRSSDFDY